MKFSCLARNVLHKLADKTASPSERRANEALDRLNEASDRIIASSASPDYLRDALDIMANKL